MNGEGQSGEIRFIRHETQSCCWNGFKNGGNESKKAPDQNSHIYSHTDWKLDS